MLVALPPLPLVPVHAPGHIYSNSTVLSPGTPAAATMMPPPSTLTASPISTATATATAISKSKSNLNLSLSSCRYNTADLCWKALVTRDSQARNAFVYAVVTTRIYCRPDCKARLARRANVVFYSTSIQAEQAGFRACKRCKPRANTTTTTTTTTAAAAAAGATPATTMGPTRVQAAIDGLPPSPSQSVSFSVSPSQSQSQSQSDTMLTQSRNRFCSSNRKNVDEDDKVHNGFIIPTHTTTPYQDNSNSCNRSIDGVEANIDVDVDVDTDTDHVQTKIHRAVQLVRNAALKEGTSLSLSQLSKEIGLSKWHLQRVFKRVQGVSPREMAEQIMNTKKRANTSTSTSTHGTDMTCSVAGTLVPPQHHLAVDCASASTTDCDEWVEPYDQSQNNNTALALPYKQHNDWVATYDQSHGHGQGENMDMNIIPFPASSTWESTIFPLPMTSSASGSGSGSGSTSAIERTTVDVTPAEIETLCPSVTVTVMDLGEDIYLPSNLDLDLAVDMDMDMNMDMDLDMDMDLAMNTNMDTNMNTNTNMNPELSLDTRMNLQDLLSDLFPELCSGPNYVHSCDYTYGHS